MAKRARSRFERVMFSFMGPPEVGDAAAPARELPARPVDICPTCRQPRDEHEVVRSPTLTYTVCPGAPDHGGPDPHGPDRDSPQVDSPRPGGG